MGLLCITKVGGYMANATFDWYKSNYNINNINL